MTEEENNPMSAWENLPLKVRRNRKHMYNYLRAFFEGPGKSITSITLESTTGNVKTYRITFTDETYFDYEVADGSDATVDIATSWGSTTSDTKVPSEKLTKDSLDAKAPVSHASAASTYGAGNATMYGHVKTINKLSTESYVAGEALSAYQGRALRDMIYGKQDTITDSGWKDVTYNAGYANYDTTNKLQYRKIGKLVELRGIIRSTETKSGASHTIATISDTTCRPGRSTVCVLCTGDDDFHFVVTVGSDGNIVIDRIYDGDTGQSSMTTSMTFNIQVSFFVE